MKLQISFLLLALSAFLASASKPLLPGLDRIGRGFDVTTNKLKTSSVLQFSTENGNDWTHPLTGQVYSVASNAQVQWASSSEFSSSVYLNANALAGYFINASVAADLDAQQVLQFVLNEVAALYFGEEGVFVVVAAQQLNFYEVYTSDEEDVKHSNSFAKMSDALPLVYDHEIYAAFVKRFGTHYITTASYGGVASLVVVVNASLGVGINFEAIVQGLFSNLTRGIPTGQGTGTGAVGLNAHYEAIVSTDFTTYGGFFANDFGAWTQSLLLAPAQIQKTIAPIADLISHPTKKANLNRFVGAYVSQALKK